MLTPAMLSQVNVREVVAGFVCSAEDIAFSIWRFEVKSSPPFTGDTDFKFGGQRQAGTG